MPSLLLVAALTAPTSAFPAAPDGDNAALPDGGSRLPYYECPEPDPGAEIAKTRNIQVVPQFWWEPDGMLLYLYIDGFDIPATAGFRDFDPFPASLHTLSAVLITRVRWAPDLVGEYYDGGPEAYLSVGMMWAYESDGSHQLAVTGESVAGRYSASVCLSRVWPNRLSGTVTFIGFDDWVTGPVDIQYQFDAMAGYNTRPVLLGSGSWRLFYDYNHITAEEVWDPSHWHSPVGGGER